MADAMAEQFRDAMAELHRVSESGARAVRELSEALLALPAPIRTDDDTKD